MCRVLSTRERGTVVGGARASAHTWIGLNGSMDGWMDTHVSKLQHNRWVLILHMRAADTKTLTFYASRNKKTTKAGVKAKADVAEARGAHGL